VRDVDGVAGIVFVKICAYSATIIFRIHVAIGTDRLVDYEQPNASALLTCRNERRCIQRGQNMGDERLDPQARVFFRTALSCGMLMGLSAAGFEALAYRFSETLFQHSSFEIKTVLANSIACVNAWILLSGAALFRRSLKLAGKAGLWALGYTVFGELWNRALPPIAAAAPSLWAWEWANSLAMLVFLTAGNVVFGIAAASLYGFPARRWRFAAWSSAVGTIYFFHYLFIFRAMDGSAGMDGEEAQRIMGSLINGTLMGIALAWPVERLERERVSGSAGSERATQRYK
jgi:hypothetical protein